MLSKSKKRTNLQEFMILNKFRLRLFGYSIWVLGFGISAFISSCNKSANSNANKSYLAVTHTAYQTNPLTLDFNGIPLFAGPLAYGQTTGYAGNPYDTVTTGVQGLGVFDGTAQLLGGNAAFQQNAHYSMFIYDSLDTRSLATLILKDDQATQSDTMTSVRFLNFSPGTSYAFLLTIMDTAYDSLGNKFPYIDSMLTSSRLFVGYRLAPSNYTFQFLHFGKYGVQVTQDQLNYFQMDSLNIDSLKIYNVYLQGYIDSAAATNKLLLKSVQLN